MIAIYQYSKVLRCTWQLFDLHLEFLALRWLLIRHRGDDTVIDVVHRRDFLMTVDPFPGLEQLQAHEDEEAEPVNMHDLQHREHRGEQ